jgi:hypothetical protein
MEHDPFLPEVEKFLTETRLSASRFGKLAVGDPMFVRDMRLTGRKLRPETVDALKAFMARERRKLGKRAA